MRFIEKVPDSRMLALEYSLNTRQQENRKAIIKEIQDVLTGADDRKLLLIGPCSADREDSVLEYMSKLAELKEKVKQAFLIVPRIYTSKPRTSGMGYKGLLHRPNLYDSKDDLLRGLSATRRIHFRVIAETDLFGADEML